MHHLSISSCSKIENALNSQSGLPRFEEPAKKEIIYGTFLTFESVDEMVQLETRSCDIACILLVYFSSDFGSYQEWTDI